MDTMIASAELPGYERKNVESGPRIVEAFGLRKRYGRGTGFVDALIGVDLAVEAGEIVGVLGPNGAGKTTLIEILEGLRAADAGRANVFGASVQDDAHMKRARGRMGISLQHSTLPGALTVTELLALQAAFFKNPRSTKHIIEQVGLEEKCHARVGVLSGGQQQRVAVALSLVGDPELMFLDEPTSQLDPHARRGVWQAIEEQRARRRAGILLSTHQMEEAQRLCDRVIIVAGGRIVAEGAPIDLIDAHCPERHVSFSLEQVADLSILKGDLECTALPGGGVHIRLITLDVGRLLADLSAAPNGLAGKLRDFRIEQPSLEDVFLKTTGETEIMA